MLRVGEDVILRGLGDCRFERANEALGVDGGNTWTVAFSATWEGANELPTLAFGDYLEADREGCEDSRLVRPDGDTGVYSPHVALSPGYCTLSVLFSDWSRSGQRDLRMTNDRHYYRDGSDQLWRVDADETPLQYTEAEGWRRMQIWGMGIASADITGDGYPEVYLTSQGDNKLQTLADGPAQPTFEDIALQLGATAHRPYTGGDVLPSTAWHAEFADVNNDRFLDLFVAKGNVEAQPDYATKDPNNLLLGQPDGTFVEGAEEAGIVDYQRARGGTLVDLNLDGMLDLVVVNRAEPVTLWRNVGSGDVDEAAPMGNWAAVRLHQQDTNVAAIGAWVEVQAGGQTQLSTSSPSAAATRVVSSVGCTSVSVTPARPKMRVQSGPTVRWVRGWSSKRASSRSSNGARLRQPLGTRRRRHDMATRKAFARRRRASRLRDARRGAVAPAIDLRRTAGAAACRMEARGLRPSRRVGRSRAQRQRLVSHRVRPAVRGRRAGRHADW